MDNPLFPNQEHQKNHDAVMKSAQDFMSGVDDAVQQKFNEKRTVNDQYLGAGVGLYRAVQQFRTTDMGEEAQSRLAQAADAFGAIWAEQHGLQGVKISSAVTFDRNGEPHVRLYQGDDNFVTDFSYDNMEKYLRKNGYLDEVDKQLKGELGLFDQTPEGLGGSEKTTKDGKPAPYSDPLGDLFTYAQKMPPGLRTRIVMRGLNQLGLEREEKDIIVAEMAKDGFWEPVKTQGGSTAGGGGGSGASGFSDGGSQNAANGNGSVADRPAGGVGGGDDSSAIAAFADEVEAGETQDTKPSPAADGGSENVSESDPASSTERSTPESYMVGEANLRDEKQLARVEANLKKQGFVVREINGEHYMWHPKAKVWMAADGHTVVERNGTLVDSGVAPNKLQYDTDAKSLTARGPGGQGDAEVTIRKRRIVEDIPENFIKYLQFKNNQNGLGEEYLSQDSGVNRTGYEADDSQLVDGAHGGKVRDAKNRTPGKMGKTVETDTPLKQREWNRIAAFENGPNGAKGVDTFARRLNGSTHLNDGLRSRGITISPVGTEFKAYKDGAEISKDEYMKAVMEIELDAAKDIVSQFEGLSDKDKSRLLDNLSESGVINLTYAEKYLNAKAGDEKRRKQMEALNDAWLDIGKRREESILALGVGLRTQVENIASIKDAETRDRATAEFLQSLSAEDAKKVKACMEAVDEYDKALDALNKAGIKTKKIPKKDVKPKSVKELGSQPEVTA